MGIITHSQLQGIQGSLYDTNPNFMHSSFRELPENCYRFVSSWIPPKMLVVSFLIPIVFWGKNNDNISNVHPFSRLHQVVLNTVHSMKLAVKALKMGENPKWKFQASIFRCDLFGG